MDQNNHPYGSRDPVFDRDPQKNPETQPDRDQQYNRGQSYNRDPYGRQPLPGNSFARASRTCAIIGLCTFIFVFPGLILGSLAIILGMLSRGGRKKALPPATAGIRIGTFVLILTIGLTIVSLFIVIRQFGSFQNYLDQYMQFVNQYPTSL